MGKIKDLFDQHSDQITAWYNGLEQSSQFGVFFLVIVSVFFIGAYVMLSRITR
jgi:hypothetical protein